MILSWVQLNGFMLYDDVEVRPPNAGLVLITGPNGVGKSAVMEGVVWTLYGQTIRGTSPANGAECTGTVVVVHGGATYTVSRKRWNKATTLILVCDGVDLAGQTPTDTQKRIDAVFGDFDRFCSTRIFSPEFMARFGLATDKDRKSLLEGILGLGQFDRALALVRGDLSAARKKFDTATVEEARAQGALTALQGAPQETGFTPEQLADFAATAAALAERATKAAKDADAMEAVYDGVVAQVDASSKVATKLAAQRDQHQERIRTARTKADRAGVLVSCPVCLRALAPGDHTAIAQHYAHEAQADVVAVETIAKELMAQEAMVSDLATERVALSKLVAEKDRAATAAKEAAQTGARALSDARVIQARAAQAGASLAKAREAHSAHARRVQETGAEVLVLEAVEDVLGLRGARTLLLGRSLHRLQGETNAALLQMGVPYQVGISGKTTQKTGKEVDAVSVTLDGAGGGEYRGASTGQRVRIDVALVLGLAALRGGEGILFFDEVFDGLDMEGVEAVAGYLAVMARTRQVVVISHQVDLQSKLPTVAHLRAALVGGKSVLAA